MQRFLIILILFPLAGWCQNKYGVKAEVLSDYRKSVQANPKNELVDLEKAIPGIVLDIRYATTNNFLHEKVYTLSKAYARRPVAEALNQAQVAFNQLGYGIKVYDGYRPYAATVKFYELYHDTTYVASPYRGSRHNRGCALDMTIIDRKTNQELKMPTEFDSFRKEAWPTTPIQDPEARKNRETLIRIMEQNGFKVNASEWWHFDFVGWQKYPVMDVGFEQLEAATGNR